MSQKVKVFFPAFPPGNRLLIELAVWGESGNLLLSSQAEPNFVQVSDPNEAEWVLIPIFITGLSNAVGVDYLKSCGQLAQRLKKPLGLFSNSDLLLDPPVERYYLFTPGSYRSKKYQIELPAVLPFDPIIHYFQGEIDPISNQGKASVGFCGQATGNILKTIKDFLLIQQLRHQRAKRKIPYQRIPLFLPAYERSRLLTRLEKSELITTDFILRSKYRGGAQSEGEKKTVEREFYKNIRANLFTVCLRGMGNYSVRFYQTLAMGRIPVLIDTDSSVPFVDHMDFRDFYIKVPYSSRFQLDRILKDFVEGKTTQELILLQRSCRRVWLDHYQSQGMIMNLALEMQKLIEEN